MPRVRLHYHCDEPNFGDELNPWLWPRLLPGALDPEAPDQLVGIGTLLNTRLPPARRTLVFGSGVGYGPIPRLDPSFFIYCLRGPRSARALGVSSAMAVTDAALLVRGRLPASPPRHVRYSYMPHVGEVRWRPGVWQSVCDEVGVHFIDPGAPVEDVLEQIAATEVLFAEALHGAIVADALRVPWVAVWSSFSVLRFKWVDWCDSMEVPYRPVSLAGARLLLRQLGRAAITRAVERDVLAGRMRRALEAGVPRLSDDAVLARRHTQLEERLRALKADLGA